MIPPINGPWKKAASGTITNARSAFVDSSFTLENIDVKATIMTTGKKITHVPMNEPCQASLNNSFPVILPLLCFLFL